MTVQEFWDDVFGHYPYLTERFYQIIDQLEEE